MQYQALGQIVRQRTFIAVARSMVHRLLLLLLLLLPCFIFGVRAAVRINIESSPHDVNSTAAAAAAVAATAAAAPIASAAQAA